MLCQYFPYLCPYFIFTIKVAFMHKVYFPLLNEQHQSHNSSPLLKYLIILSSYYQLRPIGKCNLVSYFQIYSYTPGPPYEKFHAWKNRDVKISFLCMKMKFPRMKMKILPKSFYGLEFHAWSCVQPNYPWKFLKQKIIPGPKFPCMKLSCHNLAMHETFHRKKSWN